MRWWRATVSFTIFLSASLATSSSFPKSSLLLHHRSIHSSSKATPTDLLCILGPNYQSANVSPQVSRDLFACLKFLVPLSPSSRPNRDLLSSKRHQDEKIWFPPEPVLELARLAFDSGGDPDVIHRALDPTILPVPDVEGCKEVKCQLTRTPYGRRFINEVPNFETSSLIEYHFPHFQEVNSYMEFLFHFIVERGPTVGLNVSLNRYDLFHGHIFLSPQTGRLGILFHAREYPSFDNEVFPYEMGYCQKGSCVRFDDSMNLRNIIWLAPLPNSTSRGWDSQGVLVVLDAKEGGIIYRDFVPDYVKFVRTIYEDDFGEVAADVNCLNVGKTVPNYGIYIC